MASYRSLIIIIVVILVIGLAYIAIRGVLSITGKVSMDNSTQLRSFDESLPPITVTATDYAFEPNRITVPVGEIVRLVIKNTEGTHDFVIDQFHQTTKQLEAGEEQTLTFIPTTRGSFEFYSSVEGQKEYGMVGELVVE